MLKDFEIKKKAPGVDKVLITPFKAVVKDGTLEILFQWVGKGTTAAPHRGIFGPLISAIDVAALSCLKVKEPVCRSSPLRSAKIKVRLEEFPSEEIYILHD